MTIKLKPVLYLSAFFWAGFLTLGAVPSLKATDIFEEGEEGQASTAVSVSSQQENQNTWTPVDYLTLGISRWWSKPTAPEKPISQDAEGVDGDSPENAMGTGLKPKLDLTDPKVIEALRTLNVTQSALLLAKDISEEALELGNGATQLMIEDISSESKIHRLKVKEGLTVVLKGNTKEDKKTLKIYTSEELKAEEGSRIDVSSFPIIYRTEDNRIVYPPSMEEKNFVKLEPHGEFIEFYISGPDVFPIWSNLTYELDNRTSVKGNRFFSSLSADNSSSEEEEDADVGIKQVRTDKNKILWPSHKIKTN